MQLSLSGAVRERKGTKKLAMYSKQWNPGDTLHVFYRVFKEEDTDRYAYLAGACYGYPVSDIKGLGLHTTFIPALCKINSDGQPEGKPDILWRFSKLAPNFVRGRKARDIANVMSKNVQESMRVQLLKTVEDNYDTKNNPNAIKPIIGKLTRLIVLEAIAVQYKDGVPNFETLPTCMQPMSDAVADKLNAILVNPRYQPEDGEEWIEIEWQYPLDNNKATSGRKAAPNGVESQYRMKNQFPEKWLEVKAAIDGMSTDSDMVAKRATSAVSEARIITALGNYSALHSEDLDSCALDDELMDSVKNTIGVLYEIGAESSVTNEKVRALLMESQADKNAMFLANDTTPVSAPAPATNVQGAVAEEIKTPEGAPVPTLNDLVKEDAAVACDLEAFVEGVDLTALGGADA